MGLCQQNVISARERESIRSDWLKFPYSDYDWLKGFASKKIILSRAARRVSRLSALGSTRFDRSMFDITCLSLFELLGISV